MVYRNWHWKWKKFILVTRSSQSHLPLIFHVFCSQRQCPIMPLRLIRKPVLSWLPRCWVTGINRLAQLPISSKKRWHTIIFSNRLNIHLNRFIFFCFVAHTFTCNCAMQGCLTSVSNQIFPSFLCMPSCSIICIKIQKQTWSLPSWSLPLVQNHKINLYGLVLQVSSGSLCLLGLSLSHLWP